MQDSFLDLKGRTTSKYPSGLVHSVGYALNGITGMLLSQRNLKIQWVCGISVALVAAFLPISVSSQLALLACIGLVISAELFNSAIEKTIDGLCPTDSPIARKAKDASAGAVLVLALISSVVFMIILGTQWAFLKQNTYGFWSLAGLVLPILSLEAAKLCLGLKKLTALWSYIASLLLLGLNMANTTNIVFTGVAFALITVSAYAAFFVLGDEAGTLKA